MTVHLTVQELLMRTKRHEAITLATPHKAEGQPPGAGGTDTAVLATKWSNAMAKQAGQTSTGFVETSLMRERWLRSKCWTASLNCLSQTPGLPNVP